MATDSTKVGAAGAANQASSVGSLTGKKSNEQINKNEFLQLLVTQLKSQDPLDPMNSDQFAVNLAQFSQLEQLMSINDKIGAQGNNDLSSLPSYLGREVQLNSTTVHAQKGNAGQLSVNLANDVESLQVGLYDSSDTLIDVKQFGKLEAGNHQLKLDQLSAPEGDYKFRAEATALSGAKFAPKVAVSGLITGFVPGPDPKLLMGNTEVPLSSIVEVRIPEASQPS